MHAALTRFQVRHQELFYDVFLATRDVRHEPDCCPTGPPGEKKAAQGGQHATTGGLNIPFSNQGLAKRVGGENAQREPEHSRIPKMEPDRPPRCFSLALILHLR